MTICCWLMLFDYRFLSIIFDYNSLSFLTDWTVLHGKQFQCKSSIQFVPIFQYIWIDRPSAKHYARTPHKPNHHRKQLMFASQFSQLKSGPIDICHATFSCSSAHAFNCTLLVGCWLCCQTKGMQTQTILMKMNG